MKKTQTDAVIEAMERNGGYSTLAKLYSDALKVEGVQWKTKTPFASIRRIVQTAGPFFRIRPGLWALKSWRDRLPADVAVLAEPARASSADESVAVHSYYQGLAAEIGRFRQMKSYVPAQDGSRLCAGRRLREIAATTELPPFTYDRVLQAVKSLDVIWFNNRGFPDAAFEVENSTDFRGAFEKFIELLDFRTEFCIVAPAVRRRQFDAAIDRRAYADIRNRVQFLDYERLARLHAATAESYQLEKTAGLSW